MVVNGQRLLAHAPIADMLRTKEREHGVSHGLSEVGYDIRIKQDVRFFPNGDGTSSIWIQTPPFRGGAVQDGRFAIASAIEKFQMPTNLMGIVHDKSTWARRGLSVFNTVIEPGWNGFLTLELVFHGREELHIPAGAGIAQVVFHELSESVQYAGKYQNQADQPVEAIHG